MGLYYVETGCGCGLREASSIEQAKRAALREVGTMNGVEAVRLATGDDIAWVRAMGGFVPSDIAKA